MWIMSQFIFVFWVMCDKLLCCFGCTRVSHDLITLNWQTIIGFDEIFIVQTFQKLLNLDVAFVLLHTHFHFQFRIKHKRKKSSQQLNLHLAHGNCRGCDLTGAKKWRNWIAKEIKRAKAKFFFVVLRSIEREFFEISRNEFLLNFVTQSRADVKTSRFS